MGQTRPVPPVLPTPRLPPRGLGQNGAPGNIFQNSNIPYKFANIKVPRRKRLPKQATKADPVHICPDQLVEADPVVVKIFAQLQTAWRQERINHLIAPQRRQSAMRRHRDSERKAWARLADYLSSR